jgi:hypothetical protein
LLLLYVIQIVDQYLPDSHVFLGGVFIEVSWHSWVRHVLTSYPLQVASRTHTCLLHLLVKLASEPNVRQVNVNDMYMFIQRPAATEVLRHRKSTSAGLLVCLSPECWLNLVSYKQFSISMFPWSQKKSLQHCVIAGFHGCVNGIFALLGSCAA